MITCAITMDLMKYETNAIYTVGENITDTQAKSFIDANFAVEIPEEDKAEGKLSKLKKKVVKDEQ